MGKEPEIKRYFKDENLQCQDVYLSKNKYRPIYINEKLFKKLFDTDFEWQKASEQISSMFSLTLNKDKAKGRAIGKGYADKQSDPLNIALSGNLGSGRAYFYDDHYNIKGDKTLLATSKDERYSNGKFSIIPAMQEGIISNILYQEMKNKSYQTLAILLTGEDVDFYNEFLDENDNVISNKITMPCVLEVRYYQERELYRISNARINGDINRRILLNFAQKSAYNEAYKFCHRFLHGSWSVGNITTTASLIDFETSAFVNGRFPQYSNTNKYKSNYFGYEQLGQDIMLKTLAGELENTNDFALKLERVFNNNLHKYMSKEFCNLLGISYSKFYSKYRQEIDYLCKIFIKLSKKFLPNYYETNIFAQYVDETYIFDFSRLFKLMFLKGNDRIRNLLGLLINNSKNIVYEKNNSNKYYVDKYFQDDFVSDDNFTQSLNMALEFLEKLKVLYDNIYNGHIDKQILYKKYIVNSKRFYLTSDSYILDKLNQYYLDKSFSRKSISTILNALVLSNIKKVNKENVVHLKIYKEFILEIIASLNEFYIVLQTFDEYEINYAKLYFSDKEYMFSHVFKDGKHLLISQKIKYREMIDFSSIDYRLIVNGKEDFTEI